MKICTKCKEEKSEESFQIRKDSSDGRRGVCKCCLNEKNRSITGPSLEARRKYHREYTAAHAGNDGMVEKTRLANKKWRESNPEDDRKRQRAYRQANKEKFACYAANRRSLRNGAEGDFTLSEWLDLCTTYGGTCLRCQLEKPLSVDHIVPLSKGGSNWISNIQPLCKECNSAKGVKETDYRQLHREPSFQCP